MDNTQLRIAIANAWHDDNKGDCGIIEGIITVLQRLYPQAKFGLVSMFAEHSPSFNNAHRHLQQRFPDLEIAPSPFFSHDTSETETIYQKLAKFLPIPLSLLYLLLPLSTQHPGLRLLKEADLIITPGGQYFSTQKNQFKSLYVIFRLLYPLLIAQRHQIPYLFFSQSFEFYPAERLDNRLTRWVFSQAVAVWAREPLSYQALLQLGVPSTKISLVPDAAFALTPHQSDRVTNLLATHNLNPGQFWVVTLRNWQPEIESFLVEMTKLIEQLFARGLISQIVLVANSQGPTTVEDDRLVTRQLAQNLQGKAIAVIEDDLTPSELAALYSEAQFLIGTRFQSVILALVGGTPVYGISYAGVKVQGLMTMLGMPQLCSSMKNFKADRVIKQIQTVDLASLTKEVAHQVKLLRQQLTDAIDSTIIIDNR